MLYIEIICFSSLQHILEKIMLCCNISIHWDILNSTHAVDLAKTLDILYNLEFNKITDSRFAKTLSYTVTPWHATWKLWAQSADSRKPLVMLYCSMLWKSLFCDVCSILAETFNYTVLLHVVKKLVLWCVQHIG